MFFKYHLSRLERRYKINTSFVNIKILQISSGNSALPWQSPAFHVVGDRDVMRPQIELPLEQPEHPAQHRAAVDADAHVQVNLYTK